MESVKYSVEVPISPFRSEKLNIPDSTFDREDGNFNNYVKFSVPEGYKGQSEIQTVFGLKYLSITSNGSFNIVNNRGNHENVLGYYKVDVNVPQGENVNNADAGTNGVVTANGQYNIPAGYTGFNSFSVNIPISSDRNIWYDIADTQYDTTHENEVVWLYNTAVVPQSYSGQGNVGIQAICLSKTITSNGVYDIRNDRTADSIVGYWKVNVNVPTTLVDNANVNANNNIISNGTFTVPNDKTGFNSFTVNVPQGVPNSSIENTKSITLYRNYSSDPYILEPDTNYEALRECQIYVQVPSDINNADVGTNGVITSNGNYTVPTGKSGWNSFSVNVPQTVQGVNPLEIYFVDSGVSNHPIHSYMYTENTTGSYISIEPSQYAELWIQKSNGDVEFVVYYYKATGSVYPLTNATACYYQVYSPPSSVTAPSLGDPVVLKNDVGGANQLTINWYDKWFSGTNMPGLYTASITFPSALLGNTIRIPFFN